MSRRQALRQAGTAIALTVFAACASQRYQYLPTGVANGNTGRAQRGKAFYAIPAGAPTGNTRVMSSGIVRLKPDKGGDKIDALHVRMVVSNQSSDAPWTVEPQSQSVSFANVGGRTAPLFVQSDASSSSASVVNRGEIRTFDLYYRLPDSKASAETIPEFDFHWQVKAGDRLVTESTSFDRVAVHYDAAPVYPFYGSYPYAYPYGGYPFGFGAGFGFGWEPSPPVIVVPPSAPAPPPSKPVIVGH